MYVIKYKANKGIIIIIAIKEICNVFRRPILLTLSFNHFYLSIWEVDRIPPNINYRKRAEYSRNYSPADT